MATSTAATMETDSDASMQHTPSEPTTIPMEIDDDESTQLATVSPLGYNQTDSSSTKPAISQCVDPVITPRFVVTHYDSSYAAVLQPAIPPPPLPQQRRQRRTSGVINPVVDPPEAVDPIEALMVPISPGLMVDEPTYLARRKDDAGFFQKTFNPYIQALYGSDKSWRDIPTFCTDEDEDNLHAWGCSDPPEMEFGKDGRKLDMKWACSFFGQGKDEKGWAAEETLEQWMRARKEEVRRERQKKIEEKHKTNGWGKKWVKGG